MTSPTTPRDDIGLSEKLRKTLGGIAPKDFGGDNLAVFIASELEPLIEDETLDDSGTWKQGAIDACDRVLDAVHAHYAAQLDAQAAELERVERNRNMWKGQSERQAKALTELREEAAELVVCQYALSAAEARALRAKQERDVAYERAAMQAEQFAPPHSADLGKGHVAWRIAAAIRRLAAGDEEGK